MHFHRPDQQNVVPTDLPSFQPSDSNHAEEGGDTEPQLSKTGIIIRTIKRFKRFLRCIAIRGLTRSPLPTTPGPSIRLEQALCGKRTSNNLLWGATIFDLNFIQKVPKIWMISTGSNLLEWTKQYGEDFARDETECANKEEVPHVVELCPPHGIFLEYREQNIRSRAKGWGTPMEIEDTSNKDLLSTCLGSDKV